MLIFLVRVPTIFIECLSLMPYFYPITVEQYDVHFLKSDKNHQLGDVVSDKVSCHTMEICC